MVSDKRRRELARAKWERQQSRRRAAEARARRLRVIGSVALGVAALILVGLGIWAIVGDDDSPAPTIPTENTLTFKEPPTPTDDDTDAPTTSPTTSPTTTDGTTATTPTAPITTATTGSGTP